MLNRFRRDFAKIDREGSGAEALGAVMGMLMLFFVALAGLGFIFWPWIGVRGLVVLALFLFGFITYLMMPPEQ